MERLRSTRRDAEHPRHQGTKGQWHLDVTSHHRCCNTDEQTAIRSGKGVGKLKFSSIAGMKAELCRCLGIQLSNCLHFST